MRRIKLINKKMSQKTKARIRNLLTGFCVLFVVCCFIGLVVGLSLGLRDDDDDCPGAASKLCGSKCENIHSDVNNCGSCGKKCLSGSLCIDGSCENCAANCSTDADQCTVMPCSNVTGCTILDCDTDDDLCTESPCNSETGCAKVNCDNDDDACSMEPCNSETGCSQIDCDTDSDPCTVGPCNTVTGCALICPVLLLNAPSSNFSANYSDLQTARRLVGGSLAINSNENIQNVTVTISPASSTGTYSYTAASGSGITDGGVSSATLVLSGPATPTQFQTTLRTLKYVNSQFAASSATFTFTITNTEAREASSPVYSTIRV
eukprot:TRINITY_DN7548_c0_g1_i1.p1 TRINITY_DN7548_c0_g1~~TRINITY_DN7548_c0_g1_i1.p1  ORF type:complete len:320 (+),score=36.89 TRINITY_DN7548_c0_g1_i1:151-1110(+)